MRRTLWIFLICVFTLAVCHPLKGFNYTEKNSPRFADFSIAAKPAAHDTIIIGSYNIKHGKKVDKAIKIISEDNHLKQADILLLQEMTDQSAQKLASSLGYNYVYYPSAIHPVPDSDLGNAILSKWPIIHDEKIILPHLDPQMLQRVAVIAHININGTIVAVSSVHMDIFLQPDQRAEQVEKIINAIPDTIENKIIGGDFNSVTNIVRNTLIENFDHHGYTHATDKVLWTYKHWYFLNKKTVLDHIFTKNFIVTDSGMVKNRSASDHLPVWTEIKLQNNSTSPAQEFASDY
ncbi:MAG: endonuclease/exonuclease/phosphatase family protein [Candidatus Omnitrophica bacterium]|nr:endonuclease/exonuclease/phosphatase family protein [Candidatus Omnitrophota bacterium]